MTLSLATPTPRSLDSLLTALHPPPARVVRGALAPTPVRRIIDDSRVAEPGDLFVAEPGVHVDGHDFVQMAVERGVTAVLVQRFVPLPVEQLRCVTQVIVADVRPAMADLAAALYDFPARSLHVTGVTGTDGKTTTTSLISWLLDAAGGRRGTSGLLGTAQIKIGEQLVPNPTRFTTPKPPQIQQALATMRDQGVTHAVLESSSHALELDRLLHCDFRAAVVTNITSEHLDFHGTRARYVAAKARLFALLDATAPPTAVPILTGASDNVMPKVAILNRDDDSYPFLSSECRSPQLSYGVSDPASDVRALDIVSTARGSVFRVETPRGSVVVRTRLPGLFNVSNALAAIAYGVSQGLPLSLIAAALADFPGVPGRMQSIDRGQPFAVVVDYAHTPRSLESVLQTLRPLTSGCLLVVFGSAGERDRQKRPEMGSVAARLADFFVLTDEDPRLEHSAAILADIARGADAAGARVGQNYIILADRRRAIAEALSRARAGDTVLLAGKGHERSMLVGHESLPWDEVEIASALLCQSFLAESTGAGDVVP